MTSVRRAGCSQSPGVEREFLWGEPGRGTAIIAQAQRHLELPAVHDVFDAWGASYLLRAATGDKPRLAGKIGERTHISKTGGGERSAHGGLCRVIVLNAEVPTVAEKCERGAG